jgi:hypothetical protein
VFYALSTVGLPLTNQSYQSGEFLTPRKMERGRLKELSPRANGATQ